MALPFPSHMMSYLQDICIARQLLADLPTQWDGQQSILELKAANFNWRQMEWWGFYFEYLCYQRLSRCFCFPGDQYGRSKTACFDMKRTINWDLKAKAIKADNHRSILNDTFGIDESIQKYGSHGLIIALCDVEYNDENRSFQRDLPSGTKQQWKSSAAEVHAGL